MLKNQIDYATYAYNAKQAEFTTKLKYGDLEIVLKDGKFHFVSKGGAIISNIREILFMNSKIKGITDDITTIPPEEQRYYALNAFPKVLKIGKYDLNEEFISNFLNDITTSNNRINEAIAGIQNLYETKASLVYVDSALDRLEASINDKVSKEYVDGEIKRLGEYVDGNVNYLTWAIDQKADVKYVDDEILKVNDTLKHKADKEFVDHELNDVRHELNNKADINHTHPDLERRINDIKNEMDANFVGLLDELTDEFLSYPHDVGAYPLYKIKRGYYKVKGGYLMYKEDSPLYEWRDCVYDDGRKIEIHEHRKYRNDQYVNGKIYIIPDDENAVNGTFDYYYETLTGYSFVKKTHTHYPQGRMMYFNGQYIITDNTKIYLCLNDFVYFQTLADFNNIAGGDHIIYDLTYLNDKYYINLFHTPTLISSVWVSNDMREWKMIKTFDRFYVMNGLVCYNDKILVALVHKSDKPFIYTSIDGIHWLIREYGDYAASDIVLINEVIHIKRIGSLYTQYNHIIDEVKELDQLMATILEKIYPVGSIYTSIVNKNPGDLFGFGTWAQIKDCFMYCSSSQSLQKGGSKKITGENLPAHSHYLNLTSSQNSHNHRFDNQWEYPEGTNGYPDGWDDRSDKWGARYWRGSKNMWSVSKNTDSITHAHTVTGYTQPTGQGTDYMPPYITVYAWFRLG